MDVLTNTTSDGARGLGSTANLSDASGLFNIDSGYAMMFFCTLATVTFFATKQRTGGTPFSASAEPPAVPHLIPFVGHLWGLMRYTHEYANTLCQSTPYPIFSIPVLFDKAYLVNSPLFAQDIFRKKSVSMIPLVIEFIGRLRELSEPAKKAYADGLRSKVIHLFAARLTGSERKKMAAAALQELTGLLPQTLRSESGGPDMGRDAVVQDLWLWMRSIMTITTTSSLMGKGNNPWSKDVSLVDTYWQFEDGDPTDSTTVFDLTFRSSKKAHLTLVNVLEAYFTAGHDRLNVKNSDNHIASLTVDMAAMQREHGFTARDIAATYLIIIHAAVANVVPTLFWCVTYVFSQPALLVELRDELSAAVTIEANTAVVDADRIQSNCPLLLSVLRETQRLVSVGTLHRRVVDDTVVSTHRRESQGQSYLLKKGTNMLISMKSAHRNPLTWGPTANEFHADRFLEKQPSAMEENPDDSTHLRRVGYFPFGGGQDQCPGRHFAITHIMGTMAVLILGHDITAVGGGPISQPGFGPCRMTEDTVRPHPDADLGVRIERRQGWEEVVWQVRNDH
ncbi:Cytochrome P450 [Pyrenophora tritici-repentis]|nr:Cytochrome P450 [Pyrenophora tritici-repentis]